MPEDGLGFVRWKTTNGREDVYGVNDKAVANALDHLEFKSRDDFPAAEFYQAPFHHENALDAHLKKYDVAPDPEPTWDDNVPPDLTDGGLLLG